jgi:hypothetical protein
MHCFASGERLNGRGLHSRAFSFLGPSPSSRWRFIAALQTGTDLFQTLIAVDIRDTADVFGRQVHSRHGPFTKSEFVSKLDARVEHFAAGQRDRPAIFPPHRWALAWCWLIYADVGHVVCPSIELRQRNPSAALSSDNVAASDGFRQDRKDAGKQIKSQRTPVQKRIVVRCYR